MVKRSTLYKNNDNKTTGKITTFLTMKNNDYKRSYSILKTIYQNHKNYKRSPKTTKPNSSTFNLNCQASSADRKYAFDPSVFNKIFFTLQL